MTICVSVKIAEGLVFASDSVATIQGEIITPKGKQQGVLQTFEFANKLTQIKDYPIAIMSWGIGSVGDRTLQSLVMEFEYGYAAAGANPGYKVEKVASELTDFIKQRYDAIYPGNDPRKKPPLGLTIGGYSDKQFFAEQFDIQLPNEAVLKVTREPKPDGSPNFGMNWFGQGDALVRLVKGYDLGGLEELVRRGADKNIVQKWVDDSVSELRLVFDGMPLQDAIDFVNYAVQVVIGRFRFAAGAPTCGGEIDIVVIRPNSLEWAQRKRWAIK